MLTLHATSSRVGIRTGWRSLALLAAACAPLCSLIACNDDLARIYTGRPYQADAGCVDSYVPIAVVYAERLGAACDPTCLLQDDQLYVSSVCAPYPERAELIAPEEDAECAAALEAFLDDRSCDSESESGAADAGADEELPASDMPGPDGG